jgi:hypothetical protein
MATEVFISGSNARAKIRNPWGVLGLTVITVGIYTMFWWYFINREMRDLGRAKGVTGLGDNPGLSTAAYVLGGFTFYIATIWTIVTTTQRVQAAQRVHGEEELSGWLALVVWLVTLGLGGYVFTQYQLNKAWSREPVAPPALPGGPPSGDSDLDRIAKLRELRETGALTDEEFEAEKARILPSAPPSATQPENPGAGPPSGSGTAL